MALVDALEPDALMTTMKGEGVAEKTVLYMAMSLPGFSRRLPAR